MEEENNILMFEMRGILQAGEELRRKIEEIYRELGDNEISEIIIDRLKSQFQELVNDHVSIWINPDWKSHE